MIGLASRRRTAAEQLRRYTDPGGSYAFHTYDRWYGADGPLQPADVLLANLLSLRLTWTHVVPLFADAPGPGPDLRNRLDTALTALADTTAFEDHASLQDLEITVAPLAAANEASRHMPGWTPVTVSKVLHRRRPGIVPLIDSRVREFYGTRNPRSLRAALYEDINANRDWLTEHARGCTTPDGRPLSLLRLADILIWTPETA